MFLVFQKIFEEYLPISFWTFDKLVTFYIFPLLPWTLFFVYSHKYSFSSSKKLLFSERFFLFSERCVNSKNKHLLLSDFSINRLFIRPVLILLKTTRNKWIGWYITEEKVRVHKKIAKSYPCILLHLLYSYTCIPQIFMRYLPKWSKPRYFKAEALQVHWKARTVLVWYLLLGIRTRCSTSKIYSYLEDNRSSFFRVNLKSEIKLDRP